MKTNKNQQIIDGILAGDAAVIKTFYIKNLPYVRRFITRQGGSMADVEDVFQDALVLIYHKLRNGSLDIQCSINTYFIGICKNKWYGQLRRQHKVIYNDYLVTGTIADNTSIIDAIALQDQSQLYDKHAVGLSDTNKTLLELFFDGYSMREIASMMGYTDGYARKKKFEIKKYLMTMIQADPVYAEVAM